MSYHTSCRTFVVWIDATGPTRPARALGTANFMSASDALRLGTPPTRIESRVRVSAGCGPGTDGSRRPPGSLPALGNYPCQSVMIGGPLQVGCTFPGKHTRELMSSDPSVFD